MLPKRAGKKPIYHKSFLLTMVVSIIVLICIPLVAVQLWLVQQSTNEIRAKNTDNYVSTLRNNARSYSGQMEMLDYNALKISADPKISLPLDSKANGYDLFLAAQVVKSYSIGLPSVEDIGFYYPSKDSFLMNGYQMSEELFYGSIGALEQGTQLQLKDFLRSLEEIDVFFVRNSNSYGKFLVARPVYLDSRVEFDGVVIYVLDPDALLQTFQVNLPSSSNLAILGDKEEWLVYNSGFPVTACTGEGFSAFLRSTDQQYFALRYGNEQLNIYKYTDETTGNTFLASVIQADSQRELAAYVSRMAAFIALSLVLVVALFITTVYINYRPVKKLVMRHSGSSSGGNLSELELLDSAFFARDEKISSQRTLLASFLLGDLIYGMAVEDELLDEQFDRDRLKYFVVITVSSAELTASQANSVSEHLSKAMNDVEVYTTSMPNRPHVLFIVLSKDPIDTAEVKTDMHRALRTVIGYDCDVRLGEVVQNLEDLRSSYYSSFVELTNDVDNNDVGATVDYPVKETHFFVQQVCIGDKEKALKSLEKIEIMLGTRKLRPAYRQYYCYKLLSAFLTAINDNSISMPEEKVDALMAFRNPTRLFALLRETIIDYCDMVASVEQTYNAQIQRDLLNYVDSNLTDCELCLLSAADHMNMSIYAVSRLFKEGTGIGFKEYVTTKRLEMAYRLLRTTTDSVRDVAKSVGMDNATHFSTAFRKKFGISPIQARTGEKVQ